MPRATMKLMRAGHRDAVRRLRVFQINIRETRVWRVPTRASTKP